MAAWKNLRNRAQPESSVGQNLIYPLLAFEHARPHLSAVKLMVWLTLLALNAATAQSSSRVVVVQDSSAQNLRRMVAAGLKALTDSPDEPTAWRKIVSSNDVVGIKINTQAAPLLATHRAVVDALVEGLRSAGVPPQRIWIFDRDPVKMRQAGFAADETAREVAIVGQSGWDEEAFYENKLVGQLIWGDLLFRSTGEQLSTRSHLPKLLTRTITKLINVPVLQSHDACGLCGCLHNLSLGMVDNTRRFEHYGQNGDPAIAEICALPTVRRKLVLNVMDALVAGYAGGPAFRPQYSWQPNALFFSFDPVALDTICLQQIEAKRKEANIPSLRARASHIATAARLGLGQNDPKFIQIIEARP
ncbi:MAG: DUF362 domain-containing protein [Verrucomicrobiae bacterium]|nr:DUF362 domain-containing protein [Verrucomicrobiae bacterium]